MRSNSNVFAGLWGQRFTLKFDSRVWCKICYWRRLFEAVSMKYSQNKSTKKTLSADDYKRIIFLDGIHTNGHYLTASWTPVKTGLSAPTEYHDAMTGSSTLSAQISESYCQRIHSVRKLSHEIFLTQSRDPSKQWLVNQLWRSGNCETCQSTMTLWQLREIFWNFFGEINNLLVLKKEIFSALKVLFLYYSQGWQHWSLPYPRCTWCYTCDSSYITLLLLHNKVFLCYHKNGLVIVTNLLADGYLKKLAV